MNILVLDYKWESRLFEEVPPQFSVFFGQHISGNRLLTTMWDNAISWWDQVPILSTLVAAMQVNMAMSSAEYEVNSLRGFFSAASEALASMEGFKGWLWYFKFYILQFELLSIKNISFN